MVRDGGIELCEGKKKDGGLATGGMFKRGHSGDVALEGIIQIIIEMFI